MYLQYFEDQRYALTCVNFFRTENCESMRTPKHHPSIGQKASSTVIELITTNSISSIIACDSTRNRIYLVESIHGAYPNITFPICLDGRDILTREPFNTLGILMVGGYAHQSVSNGTHIDITSTVFIKVGRYKRRSR